jgi:RNA polymerase sigma-70 factor (ECF subfamily)
LSAGDDEELLASLYPTLRRFAAVVSSLDVEPDDLVQEAVARALARGPLAELSNPGAYLRTAVLRLASNRRRSMRRADRAATRLGASVPAGRVDAYPSDVDDLNWLAPSDRALLYLSLIEGQSDNEIAELLGIYAVTVRKRRSRALGRLRRAVTTPEDDHG